MSWALREARKREAIPLWLRDSTADVSREDCRAAIRLTSDGTDVFDTVSMVRIKHRYLPHRKAKY